MKRFLNLKKATEELKNSSERYKSKEENDFNFSINDQSNSITGRNQSQMLSKNPIRKVTTRDEDRNMIS